MVEPRALGDFSLAESIESALHILTLPDVKSSGLGPDRVLPRTSDERAAELRDMDYDDFLATPEWHETAMVIKQRAGNKCSLCGQTFALTAHHLTYERRGREIADDLLVACNRCHMAVHRMTDPKRF